MNRLIQTGFLYLCITLQSLMFDCFTLENIHLFEIPISGTVLSHICLLLFPHTRIVFHGLIALYLE